MSKCYKINVGVCALLVACIVLSMSSWPMVTEARIAKFSAIQESLVRESTNGSVVRRRRSLRQTPARQATPLPAPQIRQNG
ncbi:hypothetical protein Pint_01789 [Pistacia integerrima]|uniref:Uncharacterized protein n=1 Tax=Pistacia integerrima TaxID=434235 RepID=A0ACC0ZKX6_9ROSI|nr:hypothetical protein Pint_01789 [Pistacia integerrima]